jgi:hypothetical protein
VLPKILGPAQRHQAAKVGWRTNAREVVIAAEEGTAGLVDESDEGANLAAVGSLLIQPSNVTPSQAPEESVQGTAH